MNQTVHYYIAGGLRENRVTSPERVAFLQNKYGALFNLIPGNAPLQPAAIGTAKVKPGFAGPTKFEKKQARRKSETPVLEYEIGKPKVRPLGVKSRPGYVHAMKGVVPNNAKAVVSLSTGQYWTSESEAGRVLGVYNSTIGKKFDRYELKGISVINIKGHLLRHATMQEKKAGTYIPLREQV